MNKMLYRDISFALDQYRSDVFGQRSSKSVEGIKKIAKEWILKAGMNSDILLRYQEFVGDEELLYLDDSYRDHFFHPFHTFLIGFYLLSSLKKQSITSPFHTDEKFLKKWLLTSLWHDITYTAEKGPNWLQAFISKKMGFDLRVNQNWGPIISHPKNIKVINQISEKFSAMTGKDETYCQSWFNRQLEQFNDHGVLSAILLLRENESKKWDLDKHIDDINDIGLAIALHNYPISLYKDLEAINDDNHILNPEDSPSYNIGKLKIEDNPLAFLLAFCDTAQEWGRPSKIRPSKHIGFYGVETCPDEFKVTLKFNTQNYIKMEEASGKILTRGQARNKITKKETRRIEPLENCWMSEFWKYDISHIHL